MQGFLRQATAGQVRTIGPFIDDTDFKTLENALTIANTDIVISANGGADTVKNSGGATAHGAGGIYTLTWDATDSAAVGELSYSVKVAGALVSFGVYVVLEEAVYDAFYAASATGVPALGALEASVQSVKTKTDFFASITPGAAGGLFIAGTNAPVVITGSGDALTLLSTGGNGSGLKSTGQGSGDGIKSTAGATGHGIQGLGGATSGVGIRGAGVGAVGFNYGIEGLAAGDGAGGFFTGAGGGDGISSASGPGNGARGIGAYGLGTGNSDGVYASGTTTGDGIRAVASAGGVDIRGNITGTITTTTNLTNSGNVKKNTALAAFEFLMTDSTNHAPATGKTVAVTRSINGGAFGAGTLSAVTEVSSGIYAVDFGAGDLNGNVIVLRATATGCDDCFERVITAI